MEQKINEKSRKYEYQEQILKQTFSFTSNSPESIHKYVSAHELMKTFIAELFNRFVNVCQSHLIQ